MRSLGPRSDNVCGIIVTDKKPLLIETKGLFFAVCVETLRKFHINTKSSVGKRDLSNRMFLQNKRYAQILSHRITEKIRSVQRAPTSVFSQTSKIVPIIRGGKSNRILSYIKYSYFTVLEYYFFPGVG